MLLIWKSAEYVKVLLICGVNTSLCIMVLLASSVIFTLSYFSEVLSKFINDFVQFINLTIVLVLIEVTDNGIWYICEGLTRNQILIILNISGNYQITSQLESCSTLNVLLLLNILHKGVVSSSGTKTLNNHNSWSVVLVKRASLTCFIPPVSWVETSCKIVIVLLLVSISNNVDIHLLSSGVCDIPSHHTAHKLILLIIAGIFAGVDVDR